MKTIVVHRGARDGYQAALALAERDLLERLVTDLYWPNHLSWHPRGGLLKKLEAARQHPDLSAELTHSCWASGITSMAVDKIPHAPFAWRRRATRWTDARLGAVAGRLAGQTGAALLSYSYYGYHAFSAADPGTPKYLFQLHPHPASMRAILRQELLHHPECSESLSREWELALPEDEYQMLVSEIPMASRWIAASSFTRKTLVENGIPAHDIYLAPYGVRLDHFQPDARRKSAGGPLRVLFVGTINQRKGIKYLADAVSSFPAGFIELTICGRPVDDLSVLRSRVPGAVIRSHASGAELLAAYQSADLFVFPSAGEGFGHVLLEALACGLPALTTTHTAGPDILEEGRDGFLIPPGRVDLLCERLEWALLNRDQLSRMGRAARRTAERFTWQRFRESIGHALEASIAVPV